MRHRFFAILSIVALACRPTPSQLVIATAEPRVFAPGVISNEREQWRLTFMPDGRTAYFAESEQFFPISRRATIYVSHLEGGAWTKPVIAPFSGTHTDMDPYITRDGKRFYFSSIRPVNGAVRGDLDIWMMERTQNGWSDPVRLGTEVNSAGDELYTSASDDGTIYFASGPSRPVRGDHFDIFRARRTGAGFSERERLSSGVNTVPSASDASPVAAWEFNPEISADGRTLVFTSLRPGLGLGDLYVSRFVNGSWTQAVNLGPPVNTAADEYHPTLSRDGGNLFFVRRGPRAGDFYVVQVASINALK